MHLNGWQRLWVVGSVVLFGVIGYDTWQHLPTAKEIRAKAEEKAFLAQYEVSTGSNAIPPMAPIDYDKGYAVPVTPEDVKNCKSHSKPGDTPWACDPVIQHGFVPDVPRTQEEYDDCVRKAKATGNQWQCAPIVSAASTAAAAKIRQAAEDRIRDRLLGQQSWRVAKALALWLAICASVYAASWSLNWVRLGFKKPAA
jgi:hypothetical protein